ncbi:MAG: LysM domain-containing protein [Solirubrobacterales bacterium]
MAEPLKRETSSTPPGAAESPRPVRGRSERDLGGRSKRPPRGESKSSKRPPQSKGRSDVRSSGGQSGGRQRPVSSGSGSAPRRPRDVKAGSGARILAPLALAVCAIVCFWIIANQSSDGSVKSSSGDTSSKSTSTESTSSGAAAVTGPKRSVYVVKAGDSFSAIAEKQGVDVDMLQELNPDVDPRALQPGQKLKLKE